MRLSSRPSCSAWWWTAEAVVRGSELELVQLQAFIFHAQLAFDRHVPSGNAEAVLQARTKPADASEPLTLPVSVDSTWIGVFGSLRTIVTRLSWSELMTRRFFKALGCWLPIAVVAMWFCWRQNSSKLFGSAKFSHEEEAKVQGPCS